MNRKAFFWFLATVFLATVSPADGEQLGKIPRIGILLLNPPSNFPRRYQALQQGLRELGYIEGKSAVIETLVADGKLDQLPGLARQFVTQRVDVIVTGSSTITRVAKEATSTIPIVMAQDSDPVALGFIASLSRPGGNITGLSTYSPEISGKQLEVLKELVPRLSRLVLLRNSTNPGNALALKEVEHAAAGLGFKIQHIDVQAVKDIETAFQAARDGRADAALLLSSPLFTSQRRQLAALAIKGRLPTSYGSSEFVEDGGLMSYGTNLVDLWRRAAVYVDKILNGAKPADLPVEQPTKFELVINLKSAKQIGLAIPPNVLARADKVIK